MSSRLLAGMLLTATFAGVAVAAPDPPAGFAPSADVDVAALAQLLVARSPLLRGEMLGVDVARADLRQSRVLENPYVDAAWATIPVGATTPPDLKDPLLNVPSYTFGLSYHFTPGRRGPRIARGEALVEASSASLEATTRALTIELLRVLGALAIGALRHDALVELIAQSRGAVELAQARLRGGAGTPLDVDRVENEQSRIEQQLLATEGDMQAAAAACAGLVGVPCLEFASSAEARRFVEAWVGRALAVELDDAEHLGGRADIRAVAALERAAHAELRLAHAQAIPDPTLRLAYTHDRFILSGNQQNSLALSFSLPLPVFDHGQAQADAARARIDRYHEQRDLLVGNARIRVGLLRQVLATQRTRQERLIVTMIPRARGVLRDLERAFESRLIAVSDVIQARRALAELLLAEADSRGDAFEAALQLRAQLPWDVAPRAARPQNSTP